MVSRKSEDTLLFIGLTQKTTKFKPIHKMLTDFALQKQSIDLSDRFNFILFQESGPVYLEDFTLNFENALTLLQDYEKKIVRANIAGGIFVAATFTIDVYKRISDKAFRLIIMVDKSALKIPEHYLPVLYDMLDKVKDMPFYIDVIKLGPYDPEEYLKLEKLAKRCGGKIHEVKTPKELNETLLHLSKKKVQRDQPFYSNDTKNFISRDNLLFFENLADKPKILVSLETCSVCFKKDEHTVVQCPNCETIAHMSCWAHWAKTSNVGVPYLFRCHNCFNLLKLDKSFVEIVQEGKEPPPEIEGKRLDFLQYLQALESKGTPQVVQGQDPLVVSVDEQEDIDETSTEGDFFNDETETLEPIPQSFEPEQLQSIPQPIENDPIHEVTQPSEVLEPPLNARKQRDTGGSGIIICSNCGSMAKYTDKTCPNCHSPL